MRALPTPSADDRPKFHSNMPVSELTENDTRAIEVSVVSSAPLVTETEDGVTHETRPTPTKHHGARGLELLDPKIGRPGFKCCPTKGLRLPRIEQEPGEKA